MGEQYKTAEGLDLAKSEAGYNQVASLLMPWSEYAEAGDNLAGKYWAEVFRGDDGQQLTYVAGQHTFDPDHPMFGMIDEQWQRFLSEADSSSAMSIYEGRFPIGEDKRSTIEQGGESAYVRWLAKQVDVAEFWPEPSRQEELGHLQQSFSDDQIVSFYCLRAAYQWHRLGEVRPTIEEYLRPWLSRGRELLNSSIHSADDLIRLSPEIVGETVYFDRRNSLGRLISPRGGQLPLNQLAGDLNQFRDVRIVEQIVSLWQQEKSLFMVYGNAHLVRQRPALQTLLGAKNTKATEVLTNG